MRDLPPGQRAVQGFPRFGVDTSRPPPSMPPDSDVEVVGELAHPVRLTTADLAKIPRTTVETDFHCVAGWSAIGLTWEGWSFSDVYDRLVAPALNDDTAIEYLVFVGADGYRSIVTLADAVTADVLLADRLDGLPLTPEHGAPLRFVSPGQYGFISTKHLRRIELHATEPPAFFHPHWRIQLALRTVRPHPRARVWEEERHRFIPSWLVRPVYHRLVRLPAPRLTDDEPQGR
jgi:DMSO/TMAO reductase YedYZ molybdopterin-dependent catalytic subunit